MRCEQTREPKGVFQTNNKATQKRWDKERTKTSVLWLTSLSFFFFYFIFKLYIIVLVLPNIKMNPSQVYMCSKNMERFTNLRVILAQGPC